MKKYIYLATFALVSAPLFATDCPQKDTSACASSCSQTCNTACPATCAKDCPQSCPSDCICTPEETVKSESEDVVEVIFNQLATRSPELFETLDTEEAAECRELLGELKTLSDEFEQKVAEVVADHELLASELGIEAHASVTLK